MTTPPTIAIMSPSSDKKNGRGPGVPPVVTGAYEYRNRGGGCVSRGRARGAGGGGCRPGKDCPVLKSAMRLSITPSTERFGDGLVRDRGSGHDEEGLGLAWAPTKWRRWTTGEVSA